MKREARATDHQPTDGDKKTKRTSLDESCSICRVDVCAVRDAPQRSTASRLTANWGTPACECICAVQRWHLLAACCWLWPMVRRLQWVWRVQMRGVKQHCGVSEAGRAISMAMAAGEWTRWKSRGRHWCSAEKHRLSIRTYAGAVEKEGRRCGKQARATWGRIGLSVRIERVGARQFRYVVVCSAGSFVAAARRGRTQLQKTVLCARMHTSRPGHVQDRCNNKPAVVVCLVFRWARPEGCYRRSWP